MTLATPTLAATDWIAAQFAGEPALTNVPVFVAIASNDIPRPRRNTGGPYLTLRYLGGDDVRYLGGVLAGSRAVVEVTAWDEGTDPSRIQPIMEAAHDAIDRGSGSAGGVSILSCVRVAPVERQIAEDDKLFTQLGGEYRIRTSAP